MSSLVVDASVVVKWFLPESDSDKAERLFNAVSKAWPRACWLREWKLEQGE
jgi:predicted nucleic acid-binding protein